MTVAALLLVYALMAYTAALTKGLSFDEGQQLAVGYNLWLNGDYRMEGANGDFIKRWATLPFLVSRPNFVGQADPNWRRADAYAVGYAFFFEAGNRPERLLRQARAMAVLLGVATGWLVFACSRKVFGAVGGLISLGLYVFSPHMLAFGGLVSTDMSIVLLLLGSTCCVWRLLHGVTGARVAGSVGVLGLLVLAKLSALAIVPIAAVLVAVKLVAGRPLLVRWRERRWLVRGRRPQVAIVAMLVMIHAVGAWSAIWAHYGFRFAASPRPEEPGLILRAPPEGDEVPRVWAAVIDWSRTTHFFPEGFRRGVNALLCSDDHLGSFMDGKWTLGGRTGFFPYTLWVKTRPALMILLGLALAAGWRHAVKRGRGAAAAARGGRLIYALAPYFVLIVVYLALALTEDINLGHRHVLPIYPAIYILAGAGALAWPARWCRVALAFSAVWVVRDSLAIRPDYLAYFGAQAGGAAKGYTRLVDSSLDWGMDLPALKLWLDEHNPGGKDPVFLSYFGTDSPEYYGIRAQSLPGYGSVNWRPRTGGIPLRSGYYAISASLFQGVYTAAFGPWTKEGERTYRTVARNLEALSRLSPNSPERRALITRAPASFWPDQYFAFDHLRLARLCAWLRRRGTPPHHVGHTIFIWKLDNTELRAALWGPPVEEVDQPLILRR